MPGHAAAGTPCTDEAGALPHLSRVQPQPGLQLLRLHVCCSSAAVQSPKEGHLQAAIEPHGANKGTVMAMASGCKLQDDMLIIAAAAAQSLSKLPLEERNKLLPALIKLCGADMGIVLAVALGSKSQSCAMRRAAASAGTLIVAAQSLTELLLVERHKFLQAALSCAAPTRPL